MTGKVHEIHNIFNNTLITTTRLPENKLGVTDQSNEAMKFFRKRKLDSITESISSGHHLSQLNEESALRTMDSNIGFDGKLESIRELYKGRPRAYLDNAAAPLILSTIPHKAAELLCSQIIVNPHSHGTLGSVTEALIEGVRHQVLELLNAEPSQYEVVFCANATAGLKLIGEGRISDSHFAYLIDSHTSVIGLRSLASSYAVFRRSDDLSALPSNSIVSWPLQSNFDGTRYPGKEWVDKVRASGNLSLLDIASFAATSMPDFSEIQPDFAVMSFYKIYGMPDLGALIIRKSMSTHNFWEKKKYFGGGTVAALTPSQSYMARPERLAHLLEDGTLPIHNILTLKVAIEEFRSVFGDFTLISQHTKSIANYCRRRLRKFPGIKVLGESDSPIVTFLTSSEHHDLKIGHNEFATAASLADVHVRAGTLCNIGGFSEAVGIKDSEIATNHELYGKQCNDEVSFIKGQPTGVVRASFGPYSSIEDADALIDVVLEVTSKGPAKEPDDMSKSESYVDSETYQAAIIEALHIYPIKSCSGISVKKGLITAEGLQNDRAFCISDLMNGKILSLKQYRSMIFIKPLITDSNLIIKYEPDNAVNQQNLHSDCATEISVPIDLEKWPNFKESGQLVLCLDSKVINFFSNILGIPCTLAKHSEQRCIKPNHSKLIESRFSSTFSNSSPLLLVTTASAEDLNIPDIGVFRPNIVLRTSLPWSEDHWQGIRQASSTISLLGKCRRCNMICVTASGKTDSFPYMQLCQRRNFDGKLYFGRHAALTDKYVEGGIWAVGDIVYPF